MAEKINGYRLTTELTTNKAGMCQWAFAQKNGHDYFIKRLLSPKYPTLVAEKKLAPAIVQAMKSNAEKFYSKRKFFYDKLYECRTGNVVVVQDFFRENEFYYLVTEKIFGPFMTIGEICRLSDEKKRTLMKAILYSIIQIHDRGIVHSDLKPDNVMVRQTAAGFCTAKLIDFDSGFFEFEIPEEIIGDQPYFSPEAVLRNAGRDVPVGVKSDIFALGLMFHQYWCGEFPGFNDKEYDSASISLLEHEPLTLHPSLPPNLRSLIGDMLSKHQEDRPTAREAWKRIDPEPVAPPPPPPPPPEPPKPPLPKGFRLPTDDDL